MRHFDRRALTIVFFLLLPVAADAAACLTIEELVPEPRQSFEVFGHAMDRAGNMVVASSVGDFLAEAGIRVFDASTLEQIHEIADPDPQGNRRFGASLATDGSLVLVGAPHPRTQEVIEHAYLFETGTWSLVGTFTHPTSPYDVNFGRAVALGRDHFAISDRGTQDPNLGVSTVHVYDRVSQTRLYGLAVPDSTTSPQFGENILLTDDYLVVGDDRDDEVAPGAGAVHVFDLATGQRVAKLTRPEMTQDSTFGTSIAVSGDDLLIGSLHEVVPGEEAYGEVHVYSLSTQTWQFTLNRPADAGRLSWFGQEIAVGDGYALVSLQDGTGTTGSVLLYDLATGLRLDRFRDELDRIALGYGSTLLVAQDRAFVASPYPEYYGSIPSTVWAIDLQSVGYETVLAGDGATNDLFGERVAVDGRLAVIGAKGDDDQGAASGSAYVFDTITGFRRKLLGDSNSGSELFGSDVAIDGGTIVVGAELDIDAASQAGSAYVFNAFDGSRRFKMFADNPVFSDNYGGAVDVADGIIVVGADNASIDGTRTGAAYLHDAQTGQQLHRLLADDGAAGDDFGVAVALDDGIVVVGAESRGVVGSNSGAAYLFDVATGSQLRRLVPDDAGVGDRFGGAVAIDDGRVLVGATRDDEGGTDAGAVYVFDAVTGAQLDKIVAGDAAPFALFGQSVDLSGNLASIGAAYANNPDVFAGKAYVFDVSDGSLVETLTPTVGLDTEDYFGYDVAISGCTTLVGAYRVDDNGRESGAAYLFAVGSGTIVSVDDTPRRVDRLLEAPHPNPFNPRTTLRFDLPRRGLVTLAVHDVAGREVARIFQGRLPTGRHEFVWTGRDDAGRAVASGVYLVRLITEGGVEGRKLTLLK